MDAFPGATGERVEAVASVTFLPIKVTVTLQLVVVGALGRWVDGDYPLRSRPGHRVIGVEPLLQAVARIDIPYVYIPLATMMLAPVIV